MRQDVDPTWVENGMVYTTKRDVLTSSKLRYGGNIGISEVPEKDSLQIDEPNDLKIFKAYLSDFLA